MTLRLTPGDSAPDFTLPTVGGSSVGLSDFRGRNVLIYFYPAAGTPGCTTQACDFRDSLASFGSAGYSVLGISPDSMPALERFAAAERLPFALASDPQHDVLAAYGAWGERMLYGKSVTGVVRSTVVIDPEGTVVLARYNVKATGHVARLRRELGIDSE